MSTTDVDAGPIPAGLDRASALDAGVRRYHIRRHLVVAAALLAVSGTIVAMLWSKRASDIEAAEITTRNLARVLEEQTAFSLAAVDASLSTFTTLWANLPAGRRLDDEAMRRLLRQFTLAGSYTRSIYILDPGGRMLLHSAGDISDETFDDREYFNIHKASDRGVHISEMMKGRITGRWGMVLNRRLTDPDGRFAGVVVAALEPAKLEQAFGGLDVGPRGRLSLRHVDGRLIVRAPIA